ncbi:MAG: hypothetical protein N2517_06620 [Ignavibacteria bacterium]|nr:hypothetical protein [Ignavibacteria bacterium]
MEKKKLTYKEIEELLPDYLFGRLGEEEKQVLEYSLSEYPDLQKEIEDVRKVFGRLEKMNIENYIERRTRNIPEKVNRKISQKKNFPLNILSNKAFTTVAASIGIILIVLSFIISSRQSQQSFVATNKEDTLERKVFDEPLVKIDSIEAVFSSVEDPLKIPIFYTDIFTYDYDSFNTQGINQSLDDIVYHLILKFINDKEYFANFASFFVDENFLAQLEYLNEEDFQNILEEMKYVKF